MERYPSSKRYGRRPLLQARKSHHPPVDADMDPVNDPDYNMRNIAKQSVLLEEHLAIDRKYCHPCVVKHFLHIVGLAEEAQWMAGSKAREYPLLLTAVEFYGGLFELWLVARNDAEVRSRTLEGLRAMRRKLVNVYFL